MIDLVKRLTITAGCMEMGEKIEWGSDTALMREAASRIEELQSRLRWVITERDDTFVRMLRRVETAEAKVERLREAHTAQKHYVEELFALLDKTEETDDGRVFHPTTIRSCRAADAEKLETILANLKDTIAQTSTKEGEECDEGTYDDQPSGRLL